MILQPSSTILSEGDVSSQAAAHQLKVSQGQGHRGGFWEQHSQLPARLLPQAV